MNYPRECGNAGSRVRLVIDHDRLAMAGGKLDVARATLGAGAFTNYDDKILPIIDNLPPPVDICEGIPLLKYRKVAVSRGGYAR